MQATADAVRISVLGPLEVTDPAGQSVRVGGHRVRALLILLALDAGRVVPAQALIERLWGGDRPADAANALQSLVSRLRVALRQAGVPDRVLESCPAGYRLAVQPHAVDAIAFESQARAGRQALARGAAQEAAALLRPALGAWRGSALTDVAGEEFAFAPAARLAELRAAATLDRIEADLALGAADAALVGELRELTAADGLAERPAALLMRALAATGRQAEALGIYQQVRGRLADRLGVDPSPSLEQAYLAILRQEIPQAAVPVASGPPATLRPAQAPAVPPATPGSTADRTLRGARAAEAGHGVPRPPTSFVGRDDDLAGLLKRLAVERLVTLTGPGGVGKTRLAAETAARADGPAWFAELAPVTDPAKVPYAVLDALGLRERSIARHAADAGGDAAGRLSAFLADRDAVLVLDNCEHVIDAAAALVARLLADCPRVRVLATSREPLQIPGEVLQVVAPLAAPNPSDRSAITSGNPAVRLFADRAAAVVDGFELSEANATAVARICRTLDGMPLAIELAAPWLRTLTPAQLAGRLDDRFALLTGGSRIALPRHQTLRAVVDWSWNLLSDQERALARRLAVFPAGATLAAAERVCAGPGPLTAGAVLPTLAGLVGKSILSRATAGEDGEARYQMLDTVRAYCLERLTEAGEGTHVSDAAARYYLDLVETADPLLRTSAQVRWFRVLAAEQGNVNAAIRWVTAKGDAASALRFVRSLGYSWVQRGHGEADGLCRAVLTMDPPPLTRELAEARVICALLAAGWTWDIDSVREPLTEALAAVDRFDDGSGTCHPLAAMAGPVLLQYDGATDRAMARFERYAHSPDQWMRAIGRASLSSYAFSLGTLDGAEQHCRAGLAELRALGEHWGISMALTQLAEFTELRADHAASIAALAEAAAIGREIAAWGDLSYVEARLALIRARSGDLATARAEMTRVERTVAVRGGHMDVDRWIAFMRAELAWREGDYAESARCAAAVLTDVQGLQAPWWQSLRAQVKVRLAAAVLMQGDRDRCRKLLGEALDDAAAWTDHPALAAVLDACAVHLLTGDDPLLAARLLGAAHAVRGAFDESSPDAPPARDAARAALGPRAYLAAYASSRDLAYEQAAALGREALATR